MKLDSKKFLLTGASGGLGSEIALQLHLTGVELILVGRKTKTLEGIAKQLNNHGGAAVTYFAADISKKAEREKLIEFCKQNHTDLDGLINNAGTNEFALLCDSDGEQYADILATNLSAPIHLSHQLLPLLQNRKNAAIVNVGSTLGSIGFPGYSVYCASKFGLRGFTEALRRELFGSSIQVLYFAPRSINTSMNSQQVDAMNSELGSKSDEPKMVAKQLVDALKIGHRNQLFVGWPEKLFARLNSILPGLVDGALKKQLAIVKKYSAK